MPSIKRSQVIAANEKMGNGFVMDVERYVVWGEKQCVKHIDLDEKHVLQVEITFTTEYEKQENSFQRKEWHVPSIWLQYFTKSDTTSFMTSCGMGYKMPLGNRMGKKMFSVLQKLTHEMTDEKIMEIYGQWKNPGSFNEALVG